MIEKSFLIPDDLRPIVERDWLREAPILARLREETAQMPMAGYQIGPDQGQLMTVLTAALAPKRILEVGVFTGYSGLAMGLGMPSDATLDACDISEEYTAVARRYWDEAGVGDRMTLHIGPAIETLDRFLAEGRAGTYDLAFIDADKPNYVRYLDQVHDLLRPGGVMLADNVLWHGDLVDPRPEDEGLSAILAFNAKVRDDFRWDIGLLPIGDGVTIARKR